MKKQYHSPQTTVAPFAPLLLDVDPGSGNGGEYQPGMPVDAPRRGELDEDLILQENNENWKNGLW